MCRHAKIPDGPGYQSIRGTREEEADIATGAVGMIDPHRAGRSDIIRTGQADLVLLAREMLRDPYWACPHLRNQRGNCVLASPVPQGCAARKYGKRAPSPTI